MNIVFSFDDGRDDAYNASKILIKHGLRGSFHITTGFIDGSFLTDVFGAKRKPLTANQLVEMVRNKMDISSHGDRHVMNSEDFMVSRDKLSKLCGFKDKIGFSVPNSQYSDYELSSFREKNISKLSYIRVGRSKKCYSLIMKMQYVLYHLFHLQICFNLFNKNNILKDVNKYEINSLVILSDTRSKNLVKFIEKYKDLNATLVLMFHSIVENPSDKWEYSTKDFDEICDYISKNCCVKTLEDIANEL